MYLIIIITFILNAQNIFCQKNLQQLDADSVLNMSNCYKLRRLKIEIQTNLTVEVELHHVTKQVIVENIKIVLQVNNSENVLKTDHCLFQNKANSDNIEVHGQLMDNLFSGHIHYRNKLYEISDQPIINNVVKAVLFFQKQQTNHQCGTNSSVDVTIKRIKRDISDNHFYIDNSLPPNEQNYMELALIADLSYYNNMGNNEQKTVNRIISTANSLNSLFKLVSINVVLVYIEIWNKENKYKYEDNRAQVGKFAHYIEHNLKHVRRDVMHQLTGNEFTPPGTEGVAFLNTICSDPLHRASGLNRDYPHDLPAITARLLAHEIGHNLGLSHVDYKENDKRNCSCPDTTRCIMYPNKYVDRPAVWSVCSQRYIQERLNNKLEPYFCLKDKPNLASIKPYYSSCGNGIVEKDEDCDCGEFVPKHYNYTTPCSHCCNVTTCKFSQPNVQCASGECCDKSTCTLKKRTDVCRAVTNECDIQENCNGLDEWCPEDETLHNGAVCANGNAYCYNGECSTREDRCRTFFLDYTNKENSVSKCSDCTCGTSCQKDYMLCTLLMCETSSTMGKQRFIGNTIQRKICPSFNPKEKSFYCNGYNPMASKYHWYEPLGMRNPILVPNGAKCGNNKMCVNSKCVNVSSHSVSCPANCAADKLCSNKGRCVCKNGFTQSNCGYDVPAIILIVFILAFTIKFILLAVKNALEYRRKHKNTSPAISQPQSKPLTDAQITCKSVKNKISKFNALSNNTKK